MNSTPMKNNSTATMVTSFETPTKPDNSNPMATPIGPTSNNTLFPPNAPIRSTRKSKYPIIIPPPFPFIDIEESRI
jgi:hypothetical protein